jgi:hypothetical protein
VIALELKEYQAFEDLLRAAIGNQFDKRFSRVYRGTRLLPRLSRTDRTCVALDPKEGTVLVANILPSMKRAIDRARSGFFPEKAASKEAREALARLDAWANRNDVAVVGDVPTVIRRLHPLIGLLQITGLVENIGPLPPLKSLSGFSMLVGGVSVTKEGLRVLVEHPFSPSPVWEVQVSLLGQPGRDPEGIVRTDRPVRSTVPIDVRWRPGRRVLHADGQRIVLSGQPGRTWRGQDAVGRFQARSDPNGVLEVLDKQGERRSVRKPDGSWEHHFDGKLMRIGPDGRTELRAGGSTVRGTSVRAPAPPRLHRWQLGVGLDHSAQDELRVRQVYKGSPAAKAGVLPGDKIVAVGKRERPRQREVVNELKSAVPGARIRVVVRRDGALHTLHAISGDWDEK